MKRSKLPKPTETELGLLRVLWERGPSTVREVWERVAPVQRTGYTTVLKLLQIMFDKGLVTRDETQRSHVYAARMSQEATQRQVVGHLLDRVFAGSAHKLVMQALAVKRASAAELDQIRNLLDEIERSQK